MRWARMPTNDTDTTWKSKIGKARTTEDGGRNDAREWEGAKR